MKNIIILILLLAFFSARAEQSVETDCHFRDGEQYQTVAFPEIRRKAIETSEQLCRDMRVGVVNPLLLENFIFTYESQINSKFPPLLKQKLSGFLAVTRAYLLGQSGRDQILTTFRVSRVLNPDSSFELGSVIFYYADENANRVVLEPSLNQQCEQVIAGKSCLSVFTDLANALNPFSQGYSDLVTGKNRILIRQLQRSWQDFAVEARSQTFLDVAITSWMHRDYYAQNKLVKAHSRQYFLLHPSVVYEHVDRAIAGEKDAISLALEIVGVNCWDCKLPFGASLATVYSDRPGVKNRPQNWSLMLHIKNRYSLGYTWRNKADGGNGFYVSVDLLKSLETKSEVLQGYRDKLAQ